MSLKNPSPRPRAKKPGRSSADRAPAAPDPFDEARADSQPDCILVCEPDGTILSVNPAMVRAMGRPAETMTGTSLLAYVPEDLRESVRGDLAARAGSGMAQLSEISLCADGGLRRSMIVKGRPVIYENRPAILLFLIDITGRKALEDQLAARADELLQTSIGYQQANRKLALLSSITRHDINNQLTVLKGYLGMVASFESDPSLAQYCSKAMDAAERIAAMIRFTSEYDKIGLTPPVWQDCRSTVEEAAAQAPLGHVVVQNGIPEGREVFADPLIVKVFYNLMDNAVRYGGKITTVRLFLEDRDGMTVIVCEDNGDGVAAGEKERIFERGFGKNTGLGLALSREILDITGIAIQETGQPGTGARFEMAVPARGCRTTGTK